LTIVSLYSTIKYEFKAQEDNGIGIWGKFNVRLSPELHRQVALLAKKKHVSLNCFVEKALTNEIALQREAY